MIVEFVLKVKIKFYKFFFLYFFSIKFFRETQLLFFKFYFYYVGFDHHCPWTSKCIGKGNIISFYLFILFTFGFFVYIIVCASFIDKSNNPNYGNY